MPALWRSRDHPRVCGEHRWSTMCRAMVVGSPPRVRGTRLPAVRCRVRRRITPACAGNTHLALVMQSVSGDHPRVCGEHQQRADDPAGGGGSPPRVRGTPFSGWHFVRHPRITPACAGNTPATSLASDLDLDHPRVCGEHTVEPVDVLAAGGSPPRVRGTLVPGVGDVDVVRITPACAGNTAVAIQESRRCQDHPRVCGEHFAIEVGVGWCAGSPPRVRGTLLDCFAGSGSTRITPACAGNTAKRGVVVHSARITPACAGNTARPAA